MLISSGKIDGLCSRFGVKETLKSHSIDLNMDHTKLKFHTTDTGKTVQATLWDAQRGGQDGEGKLSFPCSFDETSLLTREKSITITIAELEIPFQIFTWKLIDE